MRYAICLAAVCLVGAGGVSMADTFASGTANEFNIDFVPISGATNPTSGIPAGNDFTFTGVNKDYRMGTYEITNTQWNKFKNSLGVPVTGNPSSAYDSNPYWATANVPTNNVSWYEAAQFVNWLNTSKGYQAVYKFTGTQGTSGYTFAPWSVSGTGYNAANPYRNSNAFYFLPTEDEWVKAAYWNGTSLQTYANKAGESLYQGNGSNGGWNYYTTQYATNPYGPWAVGSGSEELNGTYDMMGNTWEWMESPDITGDYLSNNWRGTRGGSYTSIYYDLNFLASSDRLRNEPSYEGKGAGFRVASIVPEPATMLLLTLGGIALRQKVKGKR